MVAVCGDVGQGGEELEGLKEKALATGAAECYVADMREEFVQDYLWPMVRSGAVYEHKYLLGTSIARPLLAKKQVEVALETGCDGLSHGCTGKGNDQVRFELTYKALAPHLPVIAPWREWDIVSREDAIEYAEKHDVPLNRFRRRRSTAATAICGTSRTKAERWRTRQTPLRTTSGCSQRVPPRRRTSPDEVTIAFEQAMPSPWTACG